MNISDLPGSQLFIELAEKHGHYCPMSTLGLRIGWAALRRLETELLGATFFAQTCARDGIRLALNYADLQVEVQGQHLLRFFDRDNHWEIELLPKTLDLAASYRLLPSDIERDALLEELRTADESSLLSIIRGGGDL